MVTPSGDTAPEQFGPYEVYERLGLGGMATVHRAKKRGPAGFERSVALKRMLQHLAEDPSFVESFVREAKVASLLQHPNIAQVYDFGRISGTYYIAMELVAGFDVRKLLRYSNRANEAIPLPVILSILGELCDALDYAHTFVDEAGEPLHIVHRDISPSNLIVAHTGHLKVIDFGIAKANSRQLHTESGQVKGKLGYMSPEVALGLQVGPVSDLFSVGVVAWELVTASPLFSARTDFETMRKIREEPIAPPSRFNPACPAKLDNVILSALQREPEDRVATARMVRKVLDEIATETSSYVSARVVADWMLKFVQPEDSWARAATFASGGTAALAATSVAPGSVAASTRARSPSGRTLPLPPETPTAILKSPRPGVALQRSPEDIQLASEIWGDDGHTVNESGRDVPDFHVQVATPRAQGSSDVRPATRGVPPQVTAPGRLRTPSPSSKPTERPTPPPLAELAAAAATAPPAAAGSGPLPLVGSQSLGAATAADPSGAQPAPARAMSQPLPITARGKRSSELVASTRPSSAQPSPEVRTTAPGTRRARTRSSLRPILILVALAVTAGVLAAVLVAKRAAPEEAALRFEIEPAGALVTIAGKEIGRTSPLDTVLAAGDYAVTVALDGYKPWTSTITVRAADRQTIRVALDKEETEIAIDPPAQDPPPAKQPIVAATPEPAKPEPATAEPDEDPPARTTTKQTPKRDTKRSPTKPDKHVADRSPTSKDKQPADGKDKQPADAKDKQTTLDQKLDVKVEPLPIEPAKPVETRPVRTPVVSANAVTKLSGDVPTLRARNTEAGGDVLAKMCIDEQGRVASVKIVKSNPEIASELQNALGSWRYKPYTKDGKPSPVCFPLSLRVVVKNG